MSLRLRQTQGDLAVQMYGMESVMMGSWATMNQHGYKTSAERNELSACSRRGWRKKHQLRTHQTQSCLLGFFYSQSYYFLEPPGTLQTQAPTGRGCLLLFLSWCKVKVLYYSDYSWVNLYVKTLTFKTFCSSFPNLQTLTLVQMKARRKELIVTSSCSLFVARL